MPEFQEKALLIDRREITGDIIRLNLQAPLIAGAAHPGQFVMVRVGDDADPLLRRPFSIHDAGGNGSLLLLFKIVGKGTARLARIQPGEHIDLIGPLGRGFDLNLPGDFCLAGGGMGIAPLYFLGKKLLLHSSKPGQAILGARTVDELSLFEREFHELGYTVHPCTDDGSLGHHGFVPELMGSMVSEIRTVFTCGPYPMMQLVAEKSRAAGINCQVSLETHMACGLGACLGCTVHGAQGDYLHVCTHGPVFSADEVKWTR